MNYFKLHSNCLLVKGANRSLIVDSQRNSFQLIPNDLYEILIKAEKININEIYSEYGIENEKIIAAYFNNLEELELGFFCSESELDYFPKMSLDYQSAFKIDNCAIEEVYNVETYKNLIVQLENLGCQYLEIVLFSEIENEKIIEILNLFEKSSIKQIGLIIKNDRNKDISYIQLLTTRILRLAKIILHSSDFDKELDFKSYNLTNIFYSKKNITSFKFCGIVDAKYFTPNLTHFTESLSHNSCLNRKIAIDKDGNIKNCPSMAQSFGNIKNTTLEQALNHVDFKKYWNINKDQIATCKDCEFRHICTDCRAYIEDPDDQYSKPLKCGYDPYTNVWEEWSTNPLKQKAIEYYGMQELVKKDA